MSLVVSFKVVVALLLLAGRRSSVVGVATLTIYVWGLLVQTEYIPTSLIVTMNIEWYSPVG